MTGAHAQTPGKTALLAAEPQLVVSDIAASCEFYTKKLGFTVAFSYGDPAFYAQVFRDGARLNSATSIDRPSTPHFATGSNSCRHRLLSAMPNRFSSNTRPLVSDSRSRSDRSRGALGPLSCVTPMAI
jgi:hypothetical protein